MAKWKLAGVNFDHFHMGDNLRMAQDHPDVEIVGIADEKRERMQEAVRTFGMADQRVFTDYRRCLEVTRPDIVLLCPATARHAEWIEKVAPFDVHVIIEKPFAATLAEADRMTNALQARGKQLAINWPLAWYPVHRTTWRLIAEGVIGDVVEVHFYDGNRGPLWHTTDKIEKTAAQVAAEKQDSWFYRKEHGGGSLLDYLGYGTTLGTWFLGGRTPGEVTCTVDQPQGLEVDEHSVVVARYDTGLSKFETRWGTFSDPWTYQPQPKCGFVIVGTAGTISSYDFEPTVRVQTVDYPEGRHVPADTLTPPFQNPVQYLVHCLETGQAIEGPLSVEISRIGQQIVDTAVQSADEKRTVPLIQ
ncbi:MAG: Gfo/Idh/MocA family oxidoreductase [Planctomycetales bacterium]|nr:Gfo/Idh/MocA family oxidoreductase [Planctomycetales bacterium]NIM07691.1 Gfo/Idh/MocA family oxidoreductase [Planctomycetales bacterium]NIN07194.1 Gfo/Idh/MocA family oxidoreductase [Planctomycetales bacterium]NIN76287.1 Gfo/Idh/MocA family oxidoreductase [Planctomycetales bacterium]NIO33493.1 Gfo/Idh/MocA family oxidoreductase [Planctomycetales bacterium]